jgi:hypothetical protein
MAFDGVFWDLWPGLKKKSQHHFAEECICVLAALV